MRAAGRGNRSPKVPVGVAPLTPLALITVRFLLFVSYVNLFP